MNDTKKAPVNLAWLRRGLACREARVHGGQRYRSQSTVASALGIPMRHVADMEMGRRDPSTLEQFWNIEPARTAEGGV